MLKQPTPRQNMPEIVTLEQWVPEELQGAKPAAGCTASNCLS